MRLIPSEVKNAEILSKGSRIENSEQVNASRECSHNRRDSEEKIEQKCNSSENVSVLQTRIVRLDDEKIASDFKSWCCFPNRKSQLNEVKHGVEPRIKLSEQKACTAVKFNYWSLNI